MRERRERQKMGRDEGKRLAKRGENNRGWTKDETQFASDRRREKKRERGTKQNKGTRELGNSDSVGKQTRNRGAPTMSTTNPRKQ
jgi:hypothetical protein